MKIMTITIEGPTGCGKTIAAMVLEEHLPKQQKEGKFKIKSVLDFPTKTVVTVEVNHNA